MTRRTLFPLAVAARPPGRPGATGQAQETPKPDAAKAEASADRPEARP